jgi:hypothetical protein
MFLARLPDLLDTRSRLGATPCVVAADAVRDGP